MKILNALIVDPDADARREIAGLLEEAHFDTFQANDGDHALDFACVDAFDLIVLGIGPPKSEAELFLDRIRSGLFGRTPPPMIICLATGQDQAWISNTPFSASSVALLPRPFTPRAFAAALDAAFPAD